MFERFTDRARRVVVLAQEEARMLSHNYIGTEHILLGLIHEGEGVAAKALESLDISLEAVRAQVEEIIGQGQQAPSGHIPFTPRAKKVLALSLREGTLADALPRETLLLDPEAPAERSAWFLPGIRAHEQAPSLLPLWDPLTEQLRALERNGQDVIVDAGRLGLAGWPQPLIAASDLTLLVTRSSLPALAGATSWAKTLRAQFAAVGGLSRRGVLLVNEERRWPAVPTGARVRPYTPRHIAKALQIPVVSSVDWEPDVAEVYSHGARKPRKFESSALLRGYRASAAAIHSILGANQAALAPTNGGHA